MLILLLIEVGLPNLTQSKICDKASLLVLILTRTVEFCS